jgi:mono/diheme cytochrome c family protein
MTIRAGVTLLLVSVSLVALPFGVCVRAQDVPKGDPVKGKQLWFADGCSYCHGTVGQGGRAAGPRVAQRPMPFAAFLNQVRQPAQEMPVYVEKVLSDQDVADVYAYIQALPPPPDLKTIDILN